MGVSCTLFAPSDPPSPRPPPSRAPLPPPPPDLPSTLPPPPPPDGEPTVPVSVSVQFARMYPVIRRIVRAIHRDTNTVDEITQDAALRVLSQWQTFEPPPGMSRQRAFRVWLSTAALRVSREHYQWASAKKRAGELPTDPADIRAVAKEPSAETVLIGRETLRDLESATTPERWAAFYMHHVEGCSASQIAAETGAPRGTVYTWIRSAADDIRAFLARRNASWRSRIRPLK